MLVWFCFLVLAGRFASAGHMMTGEPHQVPVSSPAVLRAARFAVAEFNRDNTQEQFTYEIANITSAKVQVKVRNMWRSM